MMMRFPVVCSLIAVAGFIFVGCDVETDPLPQLPYGPANHLVINEVYTLPASNPNAHSWIEIYNPTNTTANIRFWTLNFAARAQVRTILLFYKRIGPTLVVDSIFTSFDGRDSVGQFDFLFTVTGFSTTPLRIAPGEFFTLISDKQRMLVYNNLGPGDGPEPKSSPFLGTFPNIIVVPRDTANPRLNIPDTARSFSTLFLLNQKDQIVLKDSLGRPVDVVRYGGYTYTGSGSDPYPSNQSVGVVPEFESIARYAGAYDTDNSANDFYITRPGLRPIPHWLSQLYKK